MLHHIIIVAYRIACNILYYIHFKSILLQCKVDCYTTFYKKIFEVTTYSIFITLMNVAT